MSSDCNCNVLSVFMYLDILLNWTVRTDNDKISCFIWIWQHNISCVSGNPFQYYSMASVDWSL